MFLNECKNDYCFICDDDIDWPANYVDHTLECLHRYNDNVVISYYAYSSEDFLKQHENDLECSCLGSGTCAFIPSILNANITYDELKNMYDCEIFIVNECLRKNIKIISPKRPVNFCKWKILDGINASIDSYALSLNGRIKRIENTWNYIKQNNRHIANNISYDELMKYSILIKVHQTNLIAEVLEYHGLAMPSIIFNYMDVKKSHFAAVKYAKNNNYPYVFILEDNIYPINNAKNFL